MSSMRNAVQRRPHRERAQPLERRRLGLLEKHKDYSLRAKDYNKKKEQLKRLRQKAADRNDDEFYFGMLSRQGPGQKVKDGKAWRGTAVGDRGNRAMSVDEVRLLKTQDIGYVRTMKQVFTKELRWLEEQVVLTRGLDRLDEPEDGDDDDDDDVDDEDDDDARPVTTIAKPRKIVFMDDEEERDGVMEDALDKAQGHDDDGDGDDDVGDAKDGDDAEFERAKSLRRLNRQLENTRHKVKVLTRTENELGIQRAKMAKTATSGGTTRRGKKIMVRKRKR